MRENPLPPAPSSQAPPQHDPAGTPDADFLRHKQALASQTTMTRADTLKPTTDTLSHW